jgi:ketosteroid isomerase-like protein
MKKTSMVCLLGLVSLAGAASAQSGAGTEKAIAALEQKWLAAQKAGDPAILAPLLADKFVNTDAEGKVTGKAETLEDIKTNKWDSAGYEQVKVTVFGNTAIATGVFKGKGADGKGKHLDLNDRWTDTWVKMPGGKWQCVASHASTINM